MSKKVRIALELDERFVRLLKANVGLSNPDRRHTPSDALAVVVLAEARGALEDQVHILTPIEWRPHIRAVHELREVTEEED